MVFHYSFISSIVFSEIQGELIAHTYKRIDLQRRRKLLVEKQRQKLQLERKTSNVTILRLYTGSPRVS